MQTNEKNIICRPFFARMGKKETCPFETCFTNMFLHNVHVRIFRHVSSFSFETSGYISPLHLPSKLAIFNGKLEFISKNRDSVYVVIVIESPW